LIEASADHSTYGRLKDNTLGIAFFGTPHRGGNGASIGKIAARIVTSLNGEAENTLLNTLTKDSSVLDNITSAFRAQLEDYRFISFFETRKMEKHGSMLSIVKMVGGRKQYALEVITELTSKDGSERRISDSRTLLPKRTADFP
jgi:hypothetical protein